MDFRQIIPQVTTTDGQPTFYLPLVFIVIVSMVKDFFEDYKRYEFQYVDIRLMMRKIIEKLRGIRFERESLSTISNRVSTLAILCALRINQSYLQM